MDYGMVRPNAVSSPCWATGRRAPGWPRNILGNDLAWASASALPQRRVLQHRAHTSSPPQHGAAHPGHAPELSRTSASAGRPLHDEGARRLEQL